MRFQSMLCRTASSGLQMRWWGLGKKTKATPRAKNPQPKWCFKFKPILVHPVTKRTVCKVQTKNKKKLCEKGTLKNQVSIQANEISWFSSRQSACCFRSLVLTLLVFGLLQGFGQKILLSFSVLTNGEKLFNFSNAGGQLSAINGLRALSFGWVILGHTYTFGIAYVGGCLGLFSTRTKVLNTRQSVKCQLTSCTK